MNRFFFLILGGFPFCFWEVCCLGAPVGLPTTDGFVEVEQREEVADHGPIVDVAANVEQRIYIFRP